MVCKSLGSPRPPSPTHPTLCSTHRFIIRPVYHHRTISFSPEFPSGSFWAVCPGGRFDWRRAQQPGGIVLAPQQAPATSQPASLSNSLRPFLGRGSSALPQRTSPILDPPGPHAPILSLRPHSHLSCPSALTRMLAARIPNRCRCLRLIGSPPNFCCNL